MDLIQEKVIPYIGQGCCHNRDCEFYTYKYYHKPIDGCLKWNEYQSRLSYSQIWFKFQSSRIYGLSIV